VQYGVRPLLLTPFVDNAVYLRPLLERVVRTEDQARPCTMTRGVVRDTFSLAGALP